MAQKFVKAIGLHNVFSTSSESTLDITSILPSAQAKVNQNSIVFLTATTEDEQYGYNNESKYIWTHGELYPTNNFDISDLPSNIVYSSSTLTDNQIIIGKGGSTISPSGVSITTTSPSAQSTDETIPTSKAVHSAINSALVSSLRYLGTISAYPSTSSHSSGDVYIVGTAFNHGTPTKTYEVGDMFLFNGSSWDVINGENQVTNNNASLASAGGSVTIANVDGTDITIGTPSTWTGVDKVGTITSVKLNGTTTSSGAVDLGTVLTTVASTGSGNGNAVTSVYSSGNTIYVAKDSSFASYTHNHDSSYASKSHTHGNITNDGKITSSVSITNGDAFVIAQTSNGTISKSNITFDAVTTNSFLSKAGTWESVSIEDALTTHAKTVDTTVSNKVMVSTTNGYIWRDKTVENAVGAWHGTAGSATTSGTTLYSATLWRAYLPDVSLYDGLTILYKVPVAGQGTSGTMLRIDSDDTSDVDTMLTSDTSTKYYPVCTGTTSMISTRYPVGSMVALTFDSKQTGQYVYWRAAAAATASRYIAADGGIGLTKPGCWKVASDYDSGNTNTIGYQLRYNSTVRTVTDTARYYKIYFTSADGKQWVPASANSTNNATTSRAVNQRPIDPFGEIVYTSASTSYASGGNLAAATIWQQYNITLGYSFNPSGGTLSLTNKLPVYLKCAPQTNGSAIMDSTAPCVQALPSTDDGKIYIYLGTATSATQIELSMKHPVYYYKNGAIRLWTNAADTDANITINIEGTGNAISTMSANGSVISASLGSYATTQELEDVEFVFAQQVNELSDVIGLEYDYSINWTPGLGINASTIKDAIEYAITTKDAINVSINGNQVNIKNVDIWAGTSSGTAGQVLQSNGANTPSWTPYKMPTQSPSTTGVTLYWDGSKVDWTTSGGGGGIPTPSISGSVLYSNGTTASWTSYSFAPTNSPNVVGSVLYCDTTNSVAWLSYSFMPTNSPSATGSVLYYNGYTTQWSSASPILTSSSATKSDLIPLSNNNGEIHWSSYAMPTSSPSVSGAMPLINPYGGTSSWTPYAMPTNSPSVSGAIIYATSSGYTGWTPYAMPTNSPSVSGAIPIFNVGTISNNTWSQYEMPTNAPSTIGSALCCITTNSVAWSSSSVVQSDNVLKIWAGTQLEYDNIQVKDSSTLYIIKEN